jgi:dsDNA-binding SOS-regulon protein
MKSRKSGSGKISVEKAFKLLGLPRSASIDEINRTYKSKLDEVQKKYADQLDKLVPEADQLYAAYRSAFMSKDGANEDEMLPLTITGPDSLLEVFGIQDLPQRSMKVQLQQQAQYKDGQLIKKESNKTESYINRDGKRETKVWENGKLIRHTIDGKDVLNQ